MKRLVVVCLILVVFSSYQTPATTVSNSEALTRIDTTRSLAEKPAILDANSEPIVITSNADFQAQAINKSWSGSGNSTHPYVIRNLIITDNASHRALTITDTTVYFRVVNCSFFSESEREYYYVQVMIQDTNYAIIENCTVWDGDCVLFDCRFSLLYDSTIRHQGVLGGCSYSNVTDSRAYSLEVSDCFSCLVMNNLIERNLGISSLLSVGNNTFSHNIFLNGWIDGYSETDTFEQNTRNGKELRFYSGAADEVVDASNVAGLVLRHCANMSFEDGDFTTPIEIWKSNSCQISDSMFTLNASVSISECNATLINHNSMDVYGSPIYVGWSSNTIFEFNEIELSGTSGTPAVYLDEFCYSSHIRNNSIKIAGPWDDDVPKVVFGSHESSFTGNFIEAADVQLDCPVVLENIFHSSVTIQYSDSIFHGNTIENAVGHGLCLEVLSNVTITSSRILNSSYDGIHMILCDGCRVYQNQIGWSGGFNAWSMTGGETPENSWDDGVSLGNAWSDYPGEGVYTIPGGSNEVDHYPSLLLPTTTTSITGDGSQLVLYLIIFGVGIIAVVAVVVVVKKFR